MKRKTERALWIGGSAVAGIGVVTAAVLLTRKSTTSVTTPVTTTTTSTGPTTGGTLQNDAPPGPPVSSIPAIPYTFGQPQVQTVSTPGGAYTARPVQGGTLTLTFAGPILSVSPDASYTSQVTSGNSVTFTLSGQTGTIVIKWGTGATQIVVQYTNLSVAQATNQV